MLFAVYFYLTHQVVQNPLCRPNHLWPNILEAYVPVDITTLTRNVFKSLKTRNHIQKLKKIARQKEGNLVSLELNWKTRAFKTFSWSILPGPGLESPKLKMGEGIQVTLLIHLDLSLDIFSIDYSLVYESDQAEPEQEHWHNDQATGDCALIWKRGEITKWSSVGCSQCHSYICEAEEIEKKTCAQICV